MELNSANSEMNAAVCMTREWDAFKAGENLAKDISKNLSFQSNVVLLFSTIHYQDNGGLQSLLDGIYSILPEETLLIGGTVRGFSNNYGCYVRGATALVVSSDKMDFALGVGHNTKRNPKKAAQKSAAMLKEELLSLIHI